MSKIYPPSNPPTKQGVVPSFIASLRQPETVKSIGQIQAAIKAAIDLSSREITKVKKAISNLKNPNGDRSIAKSKDEQQRLKREDDLARNEKELLALEAKYSSHRKKLKASGSALKEILYDMKRFEGKTNVQIAKIAKKNPTLVIRIETALQGLVNKTTILVKGMQTLRDDLDTVSDDLDQVFTHLVQLEERIDQTLNTVVNDILTRVANVEEKVESLQTAQLKTDETVTVVQQSVKVIQKSVEVVEEKQEAFEDHTAENFDLVFAQLKKLNAAEKKRQTVEVPDDASSVLGDLMESDGAGILMEGVDVGDIGANAENAENAENAGLTADEEDRKLPAASYRKPLGVSDKENQV
eukprot:CAMPEP_0182497890 /NCGR_PEP_ID=MMETSP1321-20130603/6266_1 /TAXON_ID=91990 /ORGANISM="Bolidomonas sp., Strain RCC1657" /LENGTH=353 /DNA_ID=CAMNT_0024701867 /DNA_START=667 /DNA_END=1728 /DNA_ORIENTATION=+